MSEDAITSAALAISDPDERANYVEYACAGNVELRRRVEVKLAAFVETQPFVQRPTDQSNGTIDQAPELASATGNWRSSEIGTVVGGKYKLMEAIGEGGMGSVYLAQQTEPFKRQIAIKFIKAGLDSKQVLARFEAERQALALMDHPNIAKVFDAGLTGESESATIGSSRPYFVMELVSGEPITKFCDARKLSLRDRLELFVQVCQAIQHAHQKGVIHRDIKPSNVLVGDYDGRPIPKVIDFGVAKAAGPQLTENTLVTGVGAIVGTPEYMSPEQASLNQLDVDTRSDVYALGVLLYELLTGTTPLDRRRQGDTSLLEVLRIVREVEPPRPSTRLSSCDDLAFIANKRGIEPAKLSQMLKGELDWVVMKSLEKDRTRRYDTVNGLAHDIQRYLANEPVEARPASASYRLRKLLQRHRGSAIAASLGLMALIAGIVGTTWGLLRADQQRAIAQDKEREAENARLDAENRAKAEADAKALAQAETRRAEEEKLRADQKSQEVRHALYAARQQVAMNAWRENRADVLGDIVERQKPGPGEIDLRGIEWGYLDRLADAPGLRWQQHGEMVNGVAITPDNRTAITVGFDGKATVWDIAMGKKKWDTGTGFRWSINAVAISPDGASVALAGHLGQLQLWTIDGTPKVKLEGHTAQVFGVAFSPDGKVISSASADLTVRLWDFATGKPLAVLGSPPPAERGQVGPRTIPQTNPSESQGHTNMVWQTAWSPDSKRLASCSSDGSVKIWSMPDQRLLRTILGHEGMVVAIAWSPDGKSIASVSRPLLGHGGGEIKLWNADTGRSEATMRPPTGGLSAVAFTPDGLYVVSGGQDRTVRVWRKDGRPVAEHRGFRDPVIGFALGGSGRWAIAGTSGGEIVGSPGTELEFAL